LHKIAAIACSLFLMTVAGFAQVPSSGGAFFGYSYTSVYLTSGSRTNLNGWNGSVEGKVLPFFGVVADFSGHYGSANLPSSGTCPVPVGGLPGGCVATTSGNVSDYAFLFGVRGSFSVKKVRPFAQILFGATRLNVNENGSGASTSTTSFAQALGGGVDYHLVPRVSLRLQADDLHTGSSVYSHNNPRLSTGVVIHF
jgi:hypothetical protein